MEIGKLDDFGEIEIKIKIIYIYIITYIYTLSK